MKGLILLAVLAVGPSEKFKGYEDFLAKHRTSLSALCSKYKATGCVIRKENIESLDELGFATESGTMKWSLYGKRK